MENVKKEAALEIPRPFVKSLQYLIEQMQV